MGYGSHGVPVWMWSGSDAQGRLSVSVTTDGECIPVTMTRYGDYGTGKTFSWLLVGVLCIVIIIAKAYGQHLLDGPSY